jgi:hypothetical protein
MKPTKIGSKNKRVKSFLNTGLGPEIVGSVPKVGRLIGMGYWLDTGILVGSTNGGVAVLRPMQCAGHYNCVASFKKPVD